MHTLKSDSLFNLAWWKWLCILLLFFTFTWGFLVPVPRLAILHESIRNLFFHVTIWFAMIILMGASLVYGIRYLRTSRIDFDTKAEKCTTVGIYLGIIGLATGSIWARNTWGAWWVNDAKLNGAAATMLVYLAYVVLRGSIDDENKRARIASVYGIFAFTMMLVFIMILPRLTVSLHPGNGGNPGFSTYDLDNSMRKLFYPAVIAQTLLAAWIAEILVRIKRLSQDE
jgi:heme exporter protein C